MPDLGHRSKDLFTLLISERGPLHPNVELMSLNRIICQLYILGSDLVVREVASRFILEASYYMVCCIYVEGNGMSMCV